MCDVEETREQQTLADEQVQPSVLDNAEGEKHEGSGDSGEQVQVCVKDIVSSEPRVTLEEAIKSDDTLTTARSLADNQQEGYHWVESLLFRTRTDALGDTIEQLCLPTPYRHRCLTLSHDKFGHAGRNKMSQRIKQYLYWPSMTVDTAKHIKSCDTCQRKDKTLPKKMTMQRR